jgi:glycogen synthase
MKILFLNYEYPPLGGGAGVCTKYHAEGLAKRGYDVSVFTTWFDGENELEENDSLKIYRLKAKRMFVHKSNPIEMLSWIKVTKSILSEHLKTNKYDLCFANFTIPGGIVSRWIKENFKIPYIIISHGQDIPWFMPQQMFLYHLINYSRLQKILNESERNILLTEMMKTRADKMLKKEKRKKNIIIPNASDIKFFSAKANAANKFNLLFSSRLVKQKQPFVFLKSLVHMRERGVSFTAHIVGDGPLRKKMEAFVRRKKLSESVHFYGWVSKKEMREFYHKSALLLVTSKEEAMSLALLEAANCGLYTITTPVSGSKEIIKAKVNGDFINFKDYLSLAEKIIYFKSNYFKNKYLIPTKEIIKVKETYNWDSIVNEYDKAIKSCLQQLRQYH